MRAFTHRHSQCVLPLLPALPLELRLHWGHAAEPSSTGSAPPSSLHHEPTAKQWGPAAAAAGCGARGCVRVVRSGRRGFMQRVGAMVHNIHDTYITFT